MIVYSDACKSLMMSAVRDMIDSAVDGGENPLPGFMRLYTDTRPAPGADITDQVLCADISLSYPCGTVAGGTLSLTTPVLDENLPESGDITWGRIVTGDGSWVCDFSVGLADDVPEPELKLTATLVYQGGIIKINTAVFTVPN